MRALEDAILRDSDTVPMEIIEFFYRKEFNLSYKELLEEPMEKFQINLEIMRLRNLREKMEMQEIEKKSRRNK